VQWQELIDAQPEPVDVLGEVHGERIHRGGGGRVRRSRRVDIGLHEAPLCRQIDHEQPIAMRAPRDVVDLHRSCAVGQRAPVAHAFHHGLLPRLGLAIPRHRGGRGEGLLEEPRPVAFDAAVSSTG